jgi:Ankyrin repeat
MHCSCTLTLSEQHHEQQQQQHRNGYTALMAASVRGHQEIVQLLVTAKAELDLKDNEVTLRTVRTDCSAHT